MKLMKLMLIAGLILLNSKIILTAQTNNERIEILYFHATIRCQGCITIEEYINKVLNSSFKENLKDSSLIYKSIDFQQPENEHFQDKYQFDVQTLIISKKVNGKEVNWKNLDKIWDNSISYSKFKKYIKDEIKKFNK